MSNKQAEIVTAKVQMCINSITLSIFRRGSRVKYLGAMLLKPTCRVVSAEGGRIEAPKAQIGVGCGEGCSVLS